MPLSDRLESDFDETARRRGLIYFMAGVVRVAAGDAYHVTATVQGKGGSYLVTLRQLEHGRMDYSCSCPAFADHGPCKHLWATVLAAEARGLVSSVSAARPGAARPPSLVQLLDQLGRVRLEVPVRPDRAPPTRAPRRPPPPAWQRWLAGCGGPEVESRPARETDVPREIRYVLDLAAWSAAEATALNVQQRVARAGGGWGKWKAFNLYTRSLVHLPDEQDRVLLSQLGAGLASSRYGYQAAPNWQGLQLLPALAPMLLPALCRTGRFHATQRDGAVGPPLQWAEGPPWRGRQELVREGEDYVCRVRLERGGEAVDLAAVMAVLPEGWIIHQHALAPLDPPAEAVLLARFRKIGSCSVPAADAPGFIEQLLKRPLLRSLTLDAGLGLTTCAPTPRPHLDIEPDGYESARLNARLSFDYGGLRLAEEAPETVHLDAAAHTVTVRDETVERAAARRLEQLGVRRSDQYFHEAVPPRVLPARRLAEVITPLLAEGWDVAARGHAYRTGSVPELEISSGIDWFELRGGARFGDQVVALPKLLQALRLKNGLVDLDDGGVGLVPEEWLRKWGGVAELGEVRGKAVRFQAGQAALLEALLAALPEVKVDEAFARARQELQAFTQIDPADPPAGFTGRLRDYQREGLGWLHFLQRFGFGGCLADDMGLGKTVQVLALLEERRAARGAHAAETRPPPSLVVAPRSLIFNWQDEARRFAPALRVLDHTGTFRQRGTEHLDDFDLVLTTYGTLRRDAALLHAYIFDYVILDEAQAIKNADTLSAKAVRLLRARHRLALSGTPIENRLADLWSLFGFLNPGLLGRATRFEKLGEETGEAGDALRAVLARALRPYILRRTKSQVARELPDRTEQTLHCELPAGQRKLYNELREHYRQALLPKLDGVGFGRQKVLILEALLRLRQAACHPGLIDPQRAREESGKLSTLLPQLQEVVAEGHKVLVFSQFTSFLALVRKRVEEAGLTYEYLDGRTADRQARVRRFQDDADCKLFLISLKAGGLGLNLTAAEYVFLLDPWWNPAVEAQAIDRAHRIGQTRQVFAYRLIARDSIEEKVLELQARKRGLADAVITADQSVLKNLTREDLELLLG